MMRYLILCFLSFSFSTFSSFDHLMNVQENTSLLQTPTDIEKYQFYKTLFDNQKNAETNIPKVIHFVYLDSRKPTKKDLKNLTQWQKLHPGWTIKFWTQKSRTLPKQILLKHIKNFCFSHLGEEFHRTLNFAEQRELLKYEILLNEGGVVVDLNMQCLQSLDSLCHCDFFCSLNPLKCPVASSSVFVSHQIMASCKNHPIIQKAIELVKEKWSVIGEIFSVNNEESARYRIHYRTLAALDQSIEKKILLTKKTDHILPSGYFFEIAKNKPLFAKQRDSYKDVIFEETYEEKLEKYIHSFANKMNNLKAFTIFYSASLFMGSFFIIRRKNRFFN